MSQIEYTEYTDVLAKTIEKAESCLSCMHSIVRQGWFICDQPQKKKQYPDKISRIVPATASCENWDILEED